MSAPVDPSRSAPAPLYSVLYRPKRDPNIASNFTHGPSFAPRPPYTIPPTASTPIHTLPAELLADIFELGQKAHAKSHVEDRGDVGGVFIPFEITASHTCQRWRELALCMPYMWTFVDFSEGPPFERSKAYVQRSRDAPLDIIIDCTGHPSANGQEQGIEDNGEVDEDDFVWPEPQHTLPLPPSSHASSPIASRSHSPVGSFIRKRYHNGLVDMSNLPAVHALILPHAYRWRLLDFRVTSYVAVHNFLRSLSTLPELLALEELLLHHYRESGDNDERFPYQEMKAPISPFQGKAPNIKSVSLWGVHLDWANCPFLCSTSLEHLEMAYHAMDVRPLYDTFASILSSAPLVALNLTASSPSGFPETWPTGRIMVPTLTSLTLGHLPPSHASALLSRLHLPSIKYLVLDFDVIDYSDTLEVISDSAHGFAGRLEGLKLKGLGAHRASRSIFYAALTGLRELKMQVGHLPLHFLDALIPGALNEVHPTTGTSTGPVALPLLSSLALAGSDGKLIRPLVVARRSAGAPLQTLLISKGTRRLTGADTEWLRNNVDHFAFYYSSDDEDADGEDSDSE